MYWVRYGVLVILLYVVLTFVFAKLGVFTVLFAIQKAGLLLALVVMAGLVIARFWQRVFGQKNNPSIKDRPHV